MKPPWSNPESEPTPEQLAAWADGELDRAEARRVEAWLVRHPEAMAQADLDRQVLRLYRDHPPEEPSAAAWQTTLERIESGLAAPRPQPVSRSWRRWWPIIGIMTAAALVGGWVVGRQLWSIPPVVPPAERPPVVFLGPGDDNDEPFPVVSLAEVSILGVAAVDADRVVVGEPLLGSFELASWNDIEVVQIDAEPDEGWTLRLQRGPEVPMIVLARVEDDES